VEEERGQQQQPKIKELFAYKNVICFAFTFYPHCFSCVLLE